MRRVVLTIETETCLAVRELREVEFIAFGIKPMRRTTIRQVMPTGINHDCRGVIEKVQVNVVKPPKRTKAEAKRWAAFGKADAEMVDLVDLPKRPVRAIDVTSRGRK